MLTPVFSLPKSAVLAANLHAPAVAWRALLAFVIPFTLGAASVQAAETEPVPARYMFIPVGFDDNDSVTLVLDGYLPNACFRLGAAKVDVDEDSGRIEVTAMARRFDPPCDPSPVPYSLEINLGYLSRGTYTVVADAGRLSQTLTIAEAHSSGPDDFLYAPVDEASVEELMDAGELRATIKGRFTNSCMALDEVRVQDTGLTINLLPIMAYGSDDCREGEFPFSTTVVLPATVWTGRHLLHVRSLNGRAVNYLFYRNRH